MRWIHSNRSFAHFAHFAHFSIASIVMAIVLAACSSPATTTSASATHSATHSAAPTATATASFTPAATPLPTVDKATVPSSCRDVPYGASPAYLPLVRVGDLIVSQVAPGISYPAYEVPQGTPQQPLKLAGPMTNPNPGSVPIEASPTTSDGLVFSICNASTSQAHTVQPVSVRVASFTPHAGALVAWNPCMDGNYDAQTQALGPGGCGGGAGVNEQLHATFPGNAQVGATVTATQSSTSPTGPNDPNPFPGLPLSLAPGQSVSVSMVVTVPTAPGTYTFAFALAVDSAAPVYFSTSAPKLFAPITTRWSGQNCMTAAMKAQIQAATQPTYYICPAA